jgi:hypothetical protein
MGLRPTHRDESPLVAALLIPTELCDDFRRSVIAGFDNLSRDAAVSSVIWSYDVCVNRYEAALVVAFLPLYFVAFGLYQYMVFAVNNRLAASERIQHSLFWRGWSRVRDNYERFYPNSFVYQISTTCSMVVVAIALAFLGLRLWEYAHGRLP